MVNSEEQNLLYLEKLSTDFDDLFGFAQNLINYQIKP